MTDGEIACTLSHLLIYIGYDR
ncbi:glycosyltransferase family 25 protein [Escherichia coli]|nr:glycosyltransferase family 25 protein [Escherichia coli]